MFNFESAQLKAGPDGAVNQTQFVSDSLIHKITVASNSVQLT